MHIQSGRYGILETINIKVNIIEVLSKIKVSTKICILHRVGVIAYELELFAS